MCSEVPDLCISLDIKCFECEKCENGKCILDLSKNNHFCDDHNPNTFDDRCLNGNCIGQGMILKKLFLLTLPWWYLQKFWFFAEFGI